MVTSSILSLCINYYYDLSHSTIFVSVPTTKSLQNSLLGEVVHNERACAKKNVHCCKFIVYGIFQKVWPFSEFCPAFDDLMLLTPYMSSYYLRS